jgi:transient receptor potential cation channel subfamily M protein 2
MIIGYKNLIFDSVLCYNFLSQACISFGVQVEELMMFMMVLVVFLLAYGVTSQGMLYKRREPSLSIITDLIQFPYWQLYGELYLEEIQSKTRVQW